MSRIKTSHISFFNCQRNNFKRFKKGSEIHNCEKKKLRINLKIRHYDQLGSSIKVQNISNSVNIS